MFFTKTALESALDSAVRDGNYSNAFSPFIDPPIDTVKSAKVICKALDNFELRTEDDYQHLNLLSQFFNNPTAKNVRDVFYERGIHLLVKHYEHLVLIEHPDHALIHQIVAIFANYEHPDTVRRITYAVASFPNGDAWYPIMDKLLTPENALYQSIIFELSSHAPGGDACLAFINALNRLIENDDLDSHPLNTLAGIEIFKTLPYNSSKGSVILADTLIHLDLLDEAYLQTLLSDGSFEMKLESARILALRGDETAIETLTVFCSSYFYAAKAEVYLIAAGQRRAVGETMKNIDFRAKARLAAYLSSVDQYAAVPDEISIYDSRELFWPPTDSIEEVWLLKYSYEDKDLEGIGMVGTVTACLHDEVTVGMDPDSCYALHCCYEMDLLNDPRCPETRTVEAGKALLNHL
ncbi:MAG: hypothetical protein HRT89_08490 [Lentisphaeria bacterium]|nr:hypothetical protein [Lentisphaeria bacterium]NQZ68094.1 hypothetical protein [Lentisphaeria bacterium]